MNPQNAWFDYVSIRLLIVRNWWTQLMQVKFGDKDSHKAWEGYSLMEI